MLHKVISHVAFKARCSHVKIFNVKESEKAGSLVELVAQYNLWLKPTVLKYKVHVQVFHLTEHLMLQIPIIKTKIINNKLLNYLV